MFRGETMTIESITISFNHVYEAFDVEIPLNKGELPLLLFFQSANGHPCFETFDNLEEMVARHEHLEKLGRTPKAYVNLKTTKFGNKKKKAKP
jgi:hypothetical protein